MEQIIRGIHHQGTPPVEIMLTVKPWKGGIWILELDQVSTLGKLVLQGIRADE